MIDSLCWPKVVPVRALSTFRRLRDLLVMLVVCWVNVRCGSKVMPRIFGFLSRGMGDEFNMIFGWIWCSCRSEVKSVTEDLEVDTDILFFPSQCSSLQMYVCNCAAAIL